MRLMVDDLIKKGPWLILNQLTITRTSIYMCLQTYDVREKGKKKEQFSCSK